MDLGVCRQMDVGSGFTMDHGDRVTGRHLSFGGLQGH